MKGIVTLRRKLPLEKSIKIFSRQSLEIAKFRDKFPSLNRTLQCTTVNDQRSTELNEEQEEFARHKAYKLHKELFNTKRHYK